VSSRITTTIKTNKQKVSRIERKKNNDKRSTEVVYKEMMIIVSLRESVELNTEMAHFQLYLLTHRLESISRQSTGPEDSPSPEGNINGGLRLMWNPWDFGLVTVCNIYGLSTFYEVLSYSYVDLFSART